MSSSRFCIIYFNTLLEFPLKELHIYTIKSIMEKPVYF